MFSILIRLRTDEILSLGQPSNIPGKCINTVTDWDITMFIAL